MCEDGLSTPIPSATYKFLKWMNADVYVARCYGTYFAMPKWTKGIRAGQTQLDVYKLFAKEELEELDIETIREKTNEALLFDAYREQEQLMVKYKKNDHIQGLENVLYMCPHCKTEFSIKVRDNSIIYCDRCSYEQKSDEYAFLHNTAGIGEEIRYVSDWSKLIYEELKRKIENNEECALSATAKIHMLNARKTGFAEVGQGTVRLQRDQFVIEGEINGEKTELVIPTGSFASLPFSPGQYLEVQSGKIIYRCVPDDGKLVMKFVNMVKIFYELNAQTKSRV